MMVHVTRSLVSLETSTDRRAFCGELIPVKDAGVASFWSVRNAFRAVKDARVATVHLCPACMYAIDDIISKIQEGD